MKNILRLCTQTLLATGLFITSARAEFNGWFSIPNPGPSGTVAIYPGNTGPIAIGNWRLSSDGLGYVEFQRTPSFGSYPAAGFMLAAQPGGTARFEILGDPASSYQVQFAYNFGLPVVGNQAGFYDANGYHALSGQGVASAIITPTVGIKFEVTAGTQPAYLQVQDWQATPGAPPPPALATARSNNTVIVSWPSPSTGFVLQQNANLGNTNGWATTGYTVTDTGTKKSITIPSPTGNLFFRLFKPS